MRGCKGIFEFYKEGDIFFVKLQDPDGKSFTSGYSLNSMQGAFNDFLERVTDELNEEE